MAATDSPPQPERRGPNISGNQVILIACVACCAALAIFIPDPTIRGACVGAIVGLIGGHANANYGPGS